jgi:hypothetical protein
MHHIYQGATNVIVGWGWKRTTAMLLWLLLQRLAGKIQWVPFSKVS